MAYRKIIRIEIKMKAKEEIILKPINLQLNKIK